VLLTFLWLPETVNVEKSEAYRKNRAFTFGAMLGALRRPTVGLLLILLAVYQVAFGGYEQMFSLFALNRLGLDATGTSALFVIAGLFIVVVQGGLVGRWSRQYGERFLVMMGLIALAIGLILTALTPRVAVPWYDRDKVLESVSGERALVGETPPTQDIGVDVPDGTKTGWLGVVWLLLASFPAALGGGVLQPSINSMITKASDPAEIGGILGISAAFLSGANAIAPVFYGSLFEWFGAPVPFFAGGAILLVLWLVTRGTLKQKAS
jgi:MFS family permease